MKYKIYVITHKNIFDDLYVGVDLSNFVFVNISDNILSSNLYQKYTILDIKINNSFINLGKWYTESEVIYNLYKNKLWDDTITHIGFLHYDIDATNLDNFILTNIKNQCHLNFQPFTFDFDFNQNIMADFMRPEELVGDGRNCYEYIFEKYKDYYNVDNICVKNIDLNLCSCFFIDIFGFINMMEWISWVIESRELDMLDTLHRHRIQGGLLERFYAVWLNLNYEFSEKIYLNHLTHLKNI